MEPKFHWKKGTFSITDLLQLGPQSQLLFSVSAEATSLPAAPSLKHTRDEALSEHRGTSDRDKCTARRSHLALLYHYEQLISAISLMTF